MTREEAKEEAIAQLERISKNLASIGETVDYTGFAIEAIQQEPVYFPPCVDCNTKMNEIREAYDNLKKQEPCEDVVSRQAVLKEIPVLWNGNGDKDYCMETLRDFVAELPPVTPTRKVGKWIKVTDTEFGIGYKCSECGRFILTESVDGRKLKDYPYCHCGADMRGGEKRKEPSEWQQDHAILKAHADGANEVLDRIKGARNEIEGLCKLEFMTKPLEIAVDRDAVLQIIDQLIAEVEG